MLLGDSQPWCMRRIVTVTVIAVFLFSCVASLHAQEKFTHDCTPSFPVTGVYTN